MCCTSYGSEEQRKRAAEEIIRNVGSRWRAVVEAAKKIHGQEIKFEEADYFAMRPELMDELLSALAALEEEAEG